MINADKPAYPVNYGVTETVVIDELGTEIDQYVQQTNGLTKREMFAMHAPDIPKWFKNEWSQNNQDNKKYFNLFLDEYDDQCPTMYCNILPAGEFALLKAWRYAYADMMLETGEDE